MENNKLEISSIMKIPKGKLEEFKQLAAETIRVTQEKDMGTFKYDIFINRDETECEVREVFENTEAFLEHTANLSESKIREKALTDFPLDHVNIYSQPSPELLEALKGVDIRVYSFFQGLEKLIEH